MFGIRSHTLSEEFGATNRYSPYFYSFNAGVLQGSVPVPTLFVLNINDLTITFISIHSFANECALHVNFQLANSPSSLDNNHRLRSNNLEQLNACKAQSCSLSNKRTKNFHSVIINLIILENRDYFNLEGVTLEHNLKWHSLSNSNLYSLYVTLYGGLFQPNLLSWPLPNSRWYFTFLSIFSWHLVLRNFFFNCTIMKIFLANYNRTKTEAPWKLTLELNNHSFPFWGS